MFGIGCWELVLVLVIILLLVGGCIFPRLRRGLGKAIMDFKRSLAENGGPDSTRSESTKNNP